MTAPATADGRDKKCNNNPAGIGRGIKKAMREEVQLIGSGRTDSGVHARGQVANFNTDSRIPPERFSYALNSLLPRDIRVICSAEVSMDFHARFSATAKRYRYSIVANRHGTAIGWQYYYHIPMVLTLRQWSKRYNTTKAPMILRHLWRQVLLLNLLCEPFTMPGF